MAKSKIYRFHVESVRKWPRLKCMRYQEGRGYPVKSHGFYCFAVEKGKKWIMRWYCLVDSIVKMSPKMGVLRKGGWDV